MWYKPRIGISAGRYTPNDYRIKARELLLVIAGHVDSPAKSSYTDLWLTVSEVQGHGLLVLNLARGWGSGPSRQWLFEYDLHG